MTAPAQPEPAPAPEEKAKVEALVAACIEALERGETDPATRVCAERPDLLTRVQRRLAQLAARGLIPAADDLPSAIGPYRVLREIGSGGMGNVYLAEQVTPVRRRVALKVIKLGMDTREVVSRFQMERQTLALMNHPHIAQVFDAGITAEGRPYFVMEYVGGLMLKAFCDRRKMAPAERVRLMATVCRAVQHAHDRGFIHRDLKPSNVLVSEHEGEFVPKIIDFGIAKATAPSASGEQQQPTTSHLTRADQVLGTPEYMSPEQMRSGGVDIDTRTDVYSLGVTLYELLCGELPFDAKRLRSASRREMEQILDHELPTQPSKRLSLVGADVVAARGGERSTVQRAIAGELDWITLKALAKQREQRYPSALAFAEDLERWLRQEPVTAAPPGRTYRLRKFVRRHRVAVGAAAGVLVSLVAGLVISLRATGEAIRARDLEAVARDDMRVFFDLARDAVGNLVDVAGEQLVDVPRAEPVRQRLLADAMTFYDTLRRRQPADPVLRREWLAASERIGRLQEQTGALRDAVATFEQCIVDGRALLAEFPDEPHVLATLFTATGRLAQCLAALGRAADAERTYFAALDLIAQARPHDGPALDVAAQEAKLLTNFAIFRSDDSARAIELFERAQAIFDRLGDTRRDLEADRARLAVHYAEVLTRANRLDAAAAALATATARLRALPGDTGVARRVDEADLSMKLARVLRRLDRNGEARKAQERAITIYAQLATEHPDLPRYADQEAAGWYFLAHLGESESKPEEAADAIAKAVAIREKLAARNPQNHHLGMLYVRSLLTSADLAMQAAQRHDGDFGAAEQTLARAIAVIDPMALAHPNDSEVLKTHAAIHGANAALATVQQRFGDARREHGIVRDAARARLAVDGKDADVHYQLAMACNNLMQVHLLENDADAAVLAGEEGQRHLELGLELDARNEPLLALVPWLFARLSHSYSDLGEIDDAMATLQRMIAKPEWGADAREQGCLHLTEMLGEQPGHPGHRQWCERLLADLRQCLAARGSLADALARRPQAKGLSRQHTALRDFDLRLCAVRMLQHLGRVDEQRPLLDELARLVAVLPGLEAQRQRAFTERRASAALASDDLAGAAASAADLVGSLGHEGAACALAATIYVRASDASKVDADREQWAKAAVDCLASAIKTGEITAASLRGGMFSPLHGRPDYEALFTR